MGEEHLRKDRGRLRLAHEENEQLSITTEIVRHDEVVVVFRVCTMILQGYFWEIGMLVGGKSARDDLHKR
jgi:hypothetical protein